MKNTFRAKSKRQILSKSRLASASRATIEMMETRLLLSSSVVYSYVTDQSAYNINVGQTATVKVYLQETLNGQTSIISGHGENGLLGAGFEVVSGTRPTNPSNITAINYDSTDFGGAPVSHVNNSAVSNPNEADLLENIAITATTGVGLGNGNGAATNEVYLGSLTVTGGSTAGTTTFKLGEYNVSGLNGGNTITNPDGYDLDTSSTTPVAYTGVGATLTTFSVVTSSVALPTPTVTVTSGNMVYNGNAYTPTTTVTGTSGTDASATESYTYYAGSTANGTPLAVAPSSVGTYTVVASFAGDSTYASANSAPNTFMITAKSLTPTLTGANKPYDGTTSDSAAIFGLTGIVGSDAVTASGTATFASKNVGTAIVVNGTGITLSGAAAGNYSLSSTTATGSANITAKSLTPTITGANKTYDGTTSDAAAIFGLTGIVGSDAVTASGTATFASANVGTAIVVNGTGITLSGAAAGNYSLSSTTATGSANITAKSLTPTVTGANKTYDGTTSDAAAIFGLTGIVGSDAVTASGTATFASANVATGITVNGTGITLNGAAAGNYSLSSTTATGSANITAKSLTPTVTGANKTYDGMTSDSAAIFGLTGVVGSDAVTASGSATFASKNVATGIVVNATGITLSGAASGNYTLASTTAVGSANITAKSLTPTVTGANKTYDRTTADAGAIVGLTGIVGSDAVTASGTATFASKNVGTAIAVNATGIALSGAAAGNYSLSSTTATGSANITALSITGSITANNKTFDGTTSATIATRMLSGVISGDTVSYVGGTATFGNTGPGTGITVTATGLSLSGADAGNYTVNTTATTTANITSPIVYSYVTDLNTYNIGIGQTVTVKIYVQELLNGNTSIISGNGENGLLGAGFEIVSGTRPTNPSNITAINSDSTDFGGAPVSHVNNSAVSNPNEADLLENIAITATTGVGLGNGNGAATNEVYLGSLTVTGGTTAGTTTFKLGEYDVSGLSGGNTITNPDGYDLDTSSTTPVSYTGVGTTLTTFSVTTTAGSLPTPTVTVTSGNRVYNGSAYTPTTTVTGTSGTDASATESYTYYAGSTVTDTPLGGAPSSVGTYTVVASFSGDATYAAANSAPKTFMITAKSLTPTLTGANKPYDGTTSDSAAIFGLTGIVGSDAVTASGTATFASKNVGTGIVVSGTGIALSGAASGNYSLASTTAAGSANITAKSLTATVTGANKTYDGTTSDAAAIFGLTGVVGSDAVTASGTATFASKNVATGITVNATGIALSGAASGNYSLTSTTATGSANITAKSLTPTVTGANKTYDGTTSDAAAIFGLTGIVGSDAVTASGTATFASKNVATGVTVNATGIALSGAAAGNYTLASTTATGSANITAKSLTPTVTGANKTYDRTTSDAAAIFGLTGIVGSDAVTASGTATFSDKNVATGKTVTATGIALSGAAAGNYTLSTTTATTTANITALAITGNITANNKTVDGTTAATIASRTLTGVISGDTVSYVGGTATFANTGPGTGITVTATGLSLSGADAGNYTVNTTATTTADITVGLPTPSVTVTSGDMVYNGSAYVPTTTVTGGSGDDTTGAVTYTYYAGSTATGTPLPLAPKVVGTYTVVANFAGDTTYAAASSAPNTFHITTVSLTATIIASNKTYNGTNTASVTYNLAGIIGSDAVSANGTATFIDKNVGTGKTVTATGITLSGAAAGNYTVNTTASTTANITAKAITGSISASSKVFDGTTAATIATRTLSGVIGGDSVSYVGGTATFANAGPGTGILVTATGLSLSGADAGNYTVNTTATTTANITSKTKSVITAHAATLKGQEGRVATGTIATFTDSNKALLANSFSATIAWGDGTTSAGTVVRTAAGTFKVTGSHAYAQEKTSGYTVKVSIQGTDGSAGTVNSLAQIVDSPLDEASNLTVLQAANVSFTNKHLGTFRDQNSLNTSPTDYTGTINWGDGTTSKASFALDHSAFNVGSYWIVQGSHKYTSKKTYTVTVTLHDNDSPTKSLIVKVTIQVW